MTVNHRRKLYAFLQSPDFPGWGGSILPQLQCLEPDRPALEAWWQQHQALIHGVASSSDRLNLPKKPPQQPIARHPISGQTYNLQPTPVSPHDFATVLTWHDPEKVYWWFWRFYPEIRSGLIGH